LCLVVLPTGISPERQERTENIEIVNYGVDLWASIAMMILAVNCQIRHGVWRYGFKRANDVPL